jgi:hypothetical protein
MSQGMRRLITGPRRDIGPNGIDSVIERLSDPDAILSLYGTLGEPEYHLPTGARVAYGSVWCVDDDYDVVFDALRYDEYTGELSGTFPCFEF